MDGQGQLKIQESAEQWTVEAERGGAWVWVYSKVVEYEYKYEFYLHFLIRVYQEYNRYKEKAKQLLKPLFDLWFLVFLGDEFWLGNCNKQNKTWTKKQDQ